MGQLLETPAQLQPLPTWALGPAAICSQTANVHTGLLQLGQQVFRLQQWHMLMKYLSKPLLAALTGVFGVGVGHGVVVAVDVGIHLVRLHQVSDLHCIVHK